MTVRNRKDAEPFVTLDGSTIREIVHPRNTPSVKQSLAEASLAPNTRTFKHLHKRSEEIYYILSGRGKMHLGREEFNISTYDAIHIPPGTEHFVENTSGERLVLMCCSTPSYSDEDTDIL